MDDWMEVELNRQSSRVQVFEKTSGTAEMARITASYAGRLSAEGIRIVRCGHYAWARLTGAGANSDLLFDLSPSYQMGAPRLPETLSAAV
jgi:hypothetical protein